MSLDSRNRLAQEQSRLVQALVAGSAKPEGFDIARLNMAARVLLKKRADLVAYMWPALCQSLGDSFMQLYSEYADSHPVCTDSETTADGEAFALFVRQRQALSDAASVEMLYHLAYRKGFSAGVLRTPARIAMVLHLPWLRPFLVCIPWFGN